MRSVACRRPLRSLPAAAQRAEQVDLRAGNAGVGRRERRFGFGKAAFGIEHRE